MRTNKVFNESVGDYDLRCVRRGTIFNAWLMQPSPMCYRDFKYLYSRLRVITSAPNFWLYPYRSCRQKKADIVPQTESLYINLSSEVELLAFACDQLSAAADRKTTVYCLSHIVYLLILERQKGCVGSSILAVTWRRLRRILQGAGVQTID